MEALWGLGFRLKSAPGFRRNKIKNFRIAHLGWFLVSFRDLPLLSTEIVVLVISVLGTLNLGMFRFAEGRIDLGFPKKPEF